MGPDPLAPVNAIDLAMIAALVLAGYGGYHRGLGVMIWPVLRWLLIPSAGALLCVPLGEPLMRGLGLSTGTAHWLAYVAVALVVLLLVSLLERRVGARVSARAPWGESDAALGSVAGVVGGVGLIFITLALLNPAPADMVDWHPQEMSGDEAVSALFGAIAGTLRRLVLEESWVGGWVQTHLAGGLVPAT